MSKRTRSISAAFLAALLTIVLTGTAVSADSGFMMAVQQEAATAEADPSLGQDEAAPLEAVGVEDPAQAAGTEGKTTVSAADGDTPSLAEKDGKKKPAADTDKTAAAASEAGETAAAASEAGETATAASESGETAAAASEAGETATAASEAGETATAASGTDETANASSETAGTAGQASSTSAEQADTIRGIVAIDPGHQAPSVDMSAQEPNGPGSSEMKTKASAGTVGSYTGIGEYELNLDISLMLRDELEQRGYEVIMTREDNETAISNSERAMLANESGADICVRIHANGVDDPGVSGAMALSPGYDNPYVSHLAAKSEELAADILNSYCEATGMANQGVSYSNTMTGINWSEIPVMILEMGYMTNEQDDTQMANAEYRVLMTKGIADGIDKWFADNPSPSEGKPRKTLGGQSVDGAKPAGGKTGKAGKDFKVTAEMDNLAKEINTGFIAPAEAAGETWGVSLVDLTDRQRCSIGGDRRIRSASVLKLFIMAATFEQIYESVPEEERDTAQVDEGSYSGLLTAMITVSDNTAANSLVELLGGGDFEAGRLWLNTWCMGHGYNGTSMGRRFLADTFTEDNYTTADDCALLLASIYDGTCVCPAASEQMISLLKGQTRLNKIPAGVAAYGVPTANKTGELSDPTLGTVENDAAIIWGAKKDYVLCTLSENLASNGGAISRIVSLSEEVYKKLNQ